MQGSRLAENDSQACALQPDFTKRQKRTELIKIKMNIFCLLNLIKTSHYVLRQGFFSPKFYPSLISYLDFLFVSSVCKKQGQLLYLVFSCLCIMTKPFWLEFKNRKRPIPPPNPHTNKTFAPGRRPSMDN